MKKTFVILASLLLLISSIGFVMPQEIETNNSEDEDIIIHYFYQRGCPFCADQERFFDKLIEKYPGRIEIKKYNIGRAEDIQKLSEFEKKYDFKAIGVPTTVLEGEAFVGFTTTKIENIIKEKLGEPIYDEEPNDTTHLPIIGEVNLGLLSLPVITFILGSLDGLNVCSIGALLLILAIVIKFESRKKILLYGGLFILTTATVYGLMVFAWYGAIRAIISYVTILELIIGAAGIFGGIYFFRRFLTFYKYGPSCEVKTNKYVTRLQEKVDKILGNPNRNFMAVAGILMLFAAVVTVIELPCSFALPLVFSGVLADAGITTLASLGYILFYILLYMSIEIIIFLVAVYTKRIWYGPEKAITWVTLLASLVMFAFGLYYIYPLL